MSGAALLSTMQPPLTQTESKLYSKILFHKGGWRVMFESRFSLATGYLLCLQVPGIFTAEWCKSRYPGQSGLQRCALRFSIWTPPLSGAGEDLHTLAYIFFKITVFSTIWCLTHCFFSVTLQIASETPLDVVSWIFAFFLVHNFFLFQFFFVFFLYVLFMAPVILAGWKFQHERGSVLRLEFLSVFCLQSKSQWNLSNPSWTRDSM